MQKELMQYKKSFDLTHYQKSNHKNSSVETSLGSQLTLNDEDNIVDYDYFFNSMKLQENYHLGSQTYFDSIFTKSSIPIKYCTFKAVKKACLLEETDAENNKQQEEVKQQIKKQSIDLEADQQDEKLITFLFEYYQKRIIFSLIRENWKQNIDHSQFYQQYIEFMISYLHKQSMLFKDLKPENIVIDNQGFCKLVDYGQQKIVNKDKTSTLCGNTNQMSNDMSKFFKKNKDSGKSEDWWSWFNEINFPEKDQKDQTSRRVSKKFLQEKYLIEKEHDYHKKQINADLILNQYF